MYTKNLPLISGTAAKTLPNLTMYDRISFEDDGIDIFHTPGHSQDCISVYSRSDRILNVGDNIGDTMENIIPEIETDLEIFNKTLADYCKLNASLVVSGHNELTDSGVFKRIKSEIEIL